MLGLRGIRFLENFDDICVRELIGDGGVSLEVFLEFGIRDIGGRGVFGDFIDGLVFVRIGEVGYGLEGNYFDLKFIFELGNEFLGVVRIIEVFILRVFIGIGVVLIDNEVGCIKVFLDNGVLDSFFGISYFYSEG